MRRVKFMPTINDFSFISATLYTHSGQSMNVLNPKKKSIKINKWPESHLFLPASPLLDLQHDDRARPDVVVGQRVGVLQEERVQLQLLLARRHPGLLMQPRLDE